MSQKNNDKPRRGRGSTGCGTASPGKAAGGDRAVQEPSKTNKVKDSLEMVTTGSQTDNNEIMEQILKRLEKIDSKVDDDKEHNRMQSEHMATVERYMEVNKSTWESHKRKLLITEQQLKAANEYNRKLEAQINGIENQMKICNLRIDGKREIEGEDMIEFLVNLAQQVGANDFAPSDVLSAVRLGKRQGGQQNQRNDRPRTILVTLSNRQARNRLYYGRSRLHNSERFKGIFVNDDVTATTRRQRDEYRSVATLARAQGAEIRIHDDGLIINGTKYMLGESHMLPDNYSMERARTIESGGEIYFASHYSYLSNFASSPILVGDTLYPTAEHLYQARKCEQAKDETRLKKVINATTPLDAKRVADEIKETPEWRGHRDGVMAEVISAKFDQNEQLAKKLLSTGVMKLNEATRNEHFGIGVAINSRAIKDKSYRGTNKLGQLLMDKRDELNAVINRKEERERDEGELGETSDDSESENDQENEEGNDTGSD